MKRALEIGSAVALVAGAVALVAPSLQAIGSPPRSVRPAMSATDEPFAHIPQDRAQVVRFDMDEESLLRLSPREKRDQALDWLLFVVLNESALSLDDLTEVAHDVSPVRHGYAKPVSRFEYGVTRSRWIGKGTVVALIPAGRTALEREDLLAHVADRHRKDLGEMPETIVIFEYDIAPAWGSASLRRVGSRPAASLFTEDAGYRTARVTNLEDLERFMRETEDLTYVHRDGDALDLGGRHGLARPYRRIRVEDVAALWQADSRIQKWHRDVEAFEARWEVRTYRTPAELAALKAQHERERAELEGRMKEELGERRLVSGTGFSLDPVYDFAKFRATFGQFAPRLKKVLSETDPALAPMFDQATEGLAKDDPGAYLELADRLAKSTEPLFNWASGLLEEISEGMQVQAARYDGALQGTEVGMVLFYTDLLAKLWAIDFVKQAPEGHIEDFHPLRKIAPSPVFAQEMAEYRNARLWFGHRDDGFQVAANGEDLLFARNATRVYAASSNPLRPGEEVEPSAAYEAFLGWWNDHYEDIATYEPEYERLNEIMKWSLVVTWLAEARAENRLAFLADVAVDRSSWFPDWARRRRELRYHAWDKIGFFPRGYLGRPTEVLPLLAGEVAIRWGNTAFSEQAGYAGGVSLAKRDLFQKPRAISTATSPALRRSGLDYAARGLRPGAFRTLEGAEYQIVRSTGARGLLRVAPRPNVRMRDGFAQIARRDVERSFTRSSDGTLRIETVASDGTRRLDLGRLEIERSGAGFRVAWESREVDVAQSIARKMSAAHDPVKAALSEPMVDTVIALPDGVAVKLKGSTRWLRLSPEDRPAVDLAAGFDARIADPSNGTRSIQIAWDDAARLAERVRTAERVVIEHRWPGDRLVISFADARGPPAGRSVQVRTASGELTGSFDAARRALSVEVKDLPEALRRDPAALRDSFEAADLRAIAHEVESNALSASTVRYTTGGGGAGGAGGPRRPFFDAFDHDDFPRSARTIADDPRRARQALSDHLRDDLDRADALMAEGRTGRAVAELTELEQRYGPAPEILTRRAIYELRSGHPEGAARSLERGLGRRPRDREMLFDELRERLQGPSDGLQRDLRQLRRITEWNALHVEDASIAGRIHPTADGGHLGFEYHLPGQQRTLPVTAAELTTGGARPVVYVQDSPALSNLDFTLGVENTLRDLSSGNLARVVRLPRGDVARFRPATIYAPAEVGVERARPTSAPRQVRLNLGSGSDDEDDDETQQRPVYFVIASPGTNGES